MAFLEAKEMLKKHIIQHSFFQSNKLKYTVFSSKQQQKITCKYSYGILHGAQSTGSSSNSSCEANFL